MPTPSSDLSWAECCGTCENFIPNSPWQEDGFGGCDQVGTVHEYRHCPLYIWSDVGVDILEEYAAKHEKGVADDDTDAE